jgi:hypothetical protein
MRRIIASSNCEDDAVAAIEENVRKIVSSGRRSALALKKTRSRLPAI